jgi:membrane associated rhomboid family serine protease
VGPALAVAVVALAIGGGSTAWAIAIFGIFTGLVVAWFFTHPIVPGS